MTQTTPTKDLFPTLISDIKSYSGDDPLLPWLSGVRKLRDSLPPQLLKEKLPRFLQKCAQRFESDRRYRNDLRYLRIWLQLMDYVDDPKALLKNMETKKIGIKKALFYQAYALYYEKLKRFELADQKYRLGVQNLAEPLDELQKSYEQFILRMERHKNKRLQRLEKKIARRPLSDRNLTNTECSSKENDVNSFKVDENSGDSLHKECSLGTHRNSKSKVTECSQNLMPKSEAKPFNQSKLYRDVSVVTKFVDSAIVGRLEVEDDCHQGLVEPIGLANTVSRSSRNQPKIDQNADNAFKVFVDDSSDNAVKSSDQEMFKIFVDGESSNDSDPSEIQTSTDGSPSSSEVEKFVFLRPNDHQSESSGDMKFEKSSRRTQTKFREDTVVRRFVGKAILDDPEVEDICHHGLVDPTVTLKEAMEDINGMFGKPINFVRTTRRKRQEKEAFSGKNDHGGFSILPDDEFSAAECKQPSETLLSEHKDDLHEPTAFIDNLFRMPLEF